ncbi:hypothetical protein OAH04_00795 [Crocinitomicaceae bacterium]|nr:hypothetical protein [Crocinitomicaceae bacterium]
MIAKDLISKTVELELIKNLDDIDLLFEGYNGINVTATVKENISRVLRWAYDNDQLDDFYSEHYETFIQFDEPIIECKMILASSIVTKTYFDLYQFESKNDYYFKVVGSGEYADTWDWEYGFFDVRNKNSKQEVISNFKDACHDNFTQDGEFDYDEMIKEGHELLFN